MYPLQDQSSAALQQSTSDKQQKMQVALAKYEAKMAAQEAAGKPNDDHIFKWRGPKGFRYKGYGTSYKQSQPTKRSKCVAVFTDLPYEIVLEIIAYCSEKEINALAKQNSVLYKWLNEELYKANIKAGSSALFWAAAEGRLSTLKLLVTFGVDVHLATSPMNQYLNSANRWTALRNGTALHVAVKFGHLDVIDFLLKKGLDIEQKTTSIDWSKERNPMQLAIKHASPSTAMFLIRKGFGANLGDGLLQKAFEMALCKSKMPFAQQFLLLQILLQSGADPKLPVPLDPDTADAYPKTFLDIVFGYAKCVDRIPLVLALLFEHGIDIHQRLPSHSQGTALHMASMFGLTDTVQYLLDHGADIEAKDNCGRTPLAYAVAMSSVSKRSPMHDSDCWFPVPLYNGEPWVSERIHTLDWAGSVETVNLLLEHGADPDVIGTYCGGIYGYSPWDLAWQNSNRSFRVAFAASAGGLVRKK